MAAGDVGPEPLLSDFEALMWSLEHDPGLRSSFANVTVLDRPVDVRRFRRRMAGVVQVVPRLRQRVLETPGRLAPPRWAHDPAFDLDHHIRRLGLPPPGTERQLLDLATLLAQDPFDRARPLWQFVFVEGLADGRGAMLQRLHHSLTDGEGGVRLSALFLDLERGPAGPDAEVVNLAPVGPPRRSAVGAAVGLAANALRRPLGLAAGAVSGAVGALASPGEAPARTARAVATTGSLLRQLAVTDGARSPLWTGRSLRRRLEVLSVPLDDAKRAAKALGGTLNDVFVTAAAGGAGAYHRAMGKPVGELRMAMPVSTRTGRAVGGNAFTPTRALVPAGVEDPARRFTMVRDRLAALKAEPGVGLIERVLGVANGLPVAALTAVARQQAQTVDFTASNVRGAPFDLYVGGARVEVNYPLGPLAGTAFNLTLLSHRGRLDMGCHIDVAAVVDPGLLRRCLIEAFDEVLALA
jgi:diacylglycerol O-acyltransferase / wax synthase